MASIEFIQKRIDGKEKEIEKLEKKLERIRKAESTNWEVNPYYYGESDLKYTLRDIERAKVALDGYKSDLAKETEKENSRNIPAILEFLEEWKRRCTEFYSNGLTEYFDEKSRLRDLYREAQEALSRPGNYETRRADYDAKMAIYDDAWGEFSVKVNGYFKTYTYTDKRLGTRTGKQKVREGEYENLKPYIDSRNYDEAMGKVEKDLIKESKRKYDFIIERTNAIVGEITDATNLRVGEAGDLNGYIVGTRGTAKVQTIGAGGYNIQCFHFRTLINKVK